MADARPDPEELLTRKEIARVLKVSPVTVRRWDRQGLMPPAAFELGKVKRWKYGDILAWVRLRVWISHGNKPEPNAPTPPKRDHKGSTGRGTAEPA